MKISRVFMVDRISLNHSFDYKYPESKQTMDKIKDDIYWLLGLMDEYKNNSLYLRSCTIYQNNSIDKIAKRRITLKKNEIISDNNIRNKIREIDITYHPNKSDFCFKGHYFNSSYGKYVLLNIRYEHNGLLDIDKCSIIIKDRVIEYKLNDEDGDIDPKLKELNESLKLLLDKLRAFLEKKYFLS